MSWNSESGEDSPRPEETPDGRPHRIVACLLLLLVIVAGCKLERDTAGPAETDSWDGSLQVYGSLRGIFHEGKLGRAVKLDVLLPSPGLHAVGALEELAGEITVIAGRMYLARAEGATARTERGYAPDAGATLLVMADVPNWQSVEIRSPIPFGALDDGIERLARAAGFEPEDRFPFLLRGTFEDLHWHVIDGRRLDEDATTHEGHVAGAVRLARERSPATLVGFYSNRDQGVFTHMGSRTHVHCVIDEPLSSGHVDHVDVPAGTILQLPLRSDRPRANDGPIPQP